MATTNASERIVQVIRVARNALQVTDREPFAVAVLKDLESTVSARTDVHAGLRYGTTLLHILLTDGGLSPSEEKAITAAHQMGYPDVVLRIAGPQDRISIYIIETMLREVFSMNLLRHPPFADTEHARDEWGIRVMAITIG